MKKLMYLVIAAVVSVAMISCEGDDKNKENGGEDKVTFVRPTSITIAGEESSTKIQYTVANEKVTKVVVSKTPVFPGSEMTYNVDNSTAGKIIVKYEHQSEGAMTITYTLDANGRPLTAKTLYDSDDYVNDSFTFTYDADGMLTLIKDIKDTDPELQHEIFKASYNKGVMDNCNASGAYMTFKYGKTINNCIVDPSLLYFIYESTEGAASIAAMLGLLPTQSKYIPTIMVAPGDEETQPLEVNVVTTMNGNKLTKYSLDMNGRKMTEYTYNY